MFGKSKLGAVCYYVSDIARTEMFYRDVLSLDIERMEGDGYGHTWLMARTANGVELIFFQQESRPGNSPVNVFDLPDGGIDNVVTALASKGTTIITPVSHAPGDGRPISPIRTAIRSRCTSRRTSPVR